MFKCSEASIGYIGLEVDVMIVETSYIKATRWLRTFLLKKMMLIYWWRSGLHIHNIVLSLTLGYRCFTLSYFKRDACFAKLGRHNANTTPLTMQFKKVQELLKVKENCFSHRRPKRKFLSTISLICSVKFILVSVTARSNIRPIIGLAYFSGYLMFCHLNFTFSL